jgi:hypothetical protein
VAIPTGVALSMASTPGQFIATFCKTMSWPFVDNLWVWVFLWLPLFALTILWLRSGEGMSPLEVLVLGLGGWCLINAVGMGYYRGGWSMGPISRYMDITSMAIVANGVAIPLVLTRCGSPRMRAAWHGLAGVWGCVVAAGTLAVSASQLADTGAKTHARNVKSEAAVIRFLNDDAISALMGRRQNELPYPHALHLATFLRCEAVRAILPSAVREPVPLKVKAGSSFVPNGTCRNSAPEMVEPFWSSFSGEPEYVGMQYTCAFESEPLPESKYPYLEFMVTGSLRAAPGQLSLGLKEGDTGRVIQALPDADIGGQWLPAVVRRPEGALTVVAADTASRHWFSFRAPREKSRLSAWADRLANFAPWVLALGLALATLWLRPFRPSSGQPVSRADVP